MPTGDYSRISAARTRLERAHASEAARTQTGQGAAQLARRNITDPDSRLIPLRGGGFIQGYNAQNVASSDGLIIAPASPMTPPTPDGMSR